MWFSEGGSVPDRVPAPDRERDLVLFKYDTCPYCGRVFAKLNALGMQIPMRDIHREAAARTELLEKTGRTTVPCLFVDGEPLFESLDIVAWLDAYAKAGFAR
jgi:glutaredoxin